MKQVWILNHYAQEPGGAGGTRHFSLARHLLQLGWRTTIIAASVELNTGRQRLSPGEARRLTEFDGVPFLWIRTPQYEGNGGGRMGNMLAYSFRALLPSATQGLARPDVIVGSSVHPFAAWAGALLAKRFRVPFVFEVRDLWPQTLVDLGRLQERSTITYVLRKLEKWLYKRADRIVVLLPQAWEYIVPLGIPREKVVWLPNGVEMDGYPEPAEPAVNPTFTLMYFGAHGQANGLDNVIRAMGLLQDRAETQHVRLRLIGDGPQKPALRQLAVSLALRNVEFSDPVPKREIPSVAAQADAFVICVRDLPALYRFGISMNKLFDYLAAARPIIMASAAANNPVDEAKAGLTVPPEDASALAKAIERVAAMSPAERNALGLAGRRFVEQNHSFEILGARFADMLNELMAEQG